MFGNVKLTKNPDPDKYSYSGYGIRFDSRSLFSCPSTDSGKNVIVFNADMSSSVHIDNKEKYILVLFVNPTQDLDNTALTAEAKYSINFNFNSFLFVNATNIYQFEEKDSEIKKYLLCLGNTSKDLSVNNMKKAG